MPDTIRVQTIMNSPAKLEWYEKNYMIWIASLSIGLITVIVNLVISFSTRKTTIKTVNNQIRATLFSKNRQDWVVEVRNELSIFLTNAKMLNIQFQQTKDQKQEIDLHAEVTSNLSKLRLLLNPSKHDHNLLLEKLELMTKILDKHYLISKENLNNFDNVSFIDTTDEIINTGRALLYSEWEKIQNSLKD